MSAEGTLLEKRPRAGRAGNAFALVWGLAEATLFFIVPDVLLSFLSLRDLRRGLRASLFALAGALLGGALMLAWGAAQPDRAREALARVPGIQVELVRQVGLECETRGAWALLLGPLRGRPYKIYAVEHGALGGSWLAFLLVSIPARWIRFALICALARTVTRALQGRLPLAAVVVWAVAWSAFYAGYFALFGW